MDSRKPFKKGLARNLFLTTVIYAPKTKNAPNAKRSRQERTSVKSQNAAPTSKSDKARGLLLNRGTFMNTRDDFFFFLSRLYCRLRNWQALTESATEEPPSFSGYTAGGETNPALKEKTKQRSESVQTRFVQILTAAIRGTIFNKRQTLNTQDSLNIERSIQHSEFCIQHSAFSICICRLRL